MSLCLAGIKYTIETLLFLSFLSGLLSHDLYTAISALPPFEQYLAILPLPFCLASRARHTMPPHGRRRAPGSRLSLTLLSVFLFSLVGPALAASSVLGIDLGTEYIKAALVKPGIPLEIVLTKDSRRKEAATLAFKPAGGVSSTAENVFPERAYGADALALAARFPGDVYPNLKPLLGLTTHDVHHGRESPAVAAYQARFPGLGIQQCSAERDTVCLRSSTFAPDEEPFAVEELLAMQLQNVRSNAEAMAGKGNTVKDVVFTVPPYWTVDEKRAVETAAQLAGLRVLAMTTDGLAVGVHYATTRTFPVVNDGEKPEYHLIFDMGAGSATATVLRFQGRSVKDVGKFNKTVQEIQVMGAGWDTTLGGDALNELIMDDLVAKLAESKPMKALNADVNEIRRNGRTMAKIWKETQRVRQILSANTETQATFEGLYNGEVSFKYKLSRADFEKLAKGYDERVRTTVQKALEMAKLKLGDINSVILHGGATRTPLVQKALEGAVKNPDLIKTNVNSDEAAAFGAAFRAAGLSPSFRVKEIRTAEAAILPVEMYWVADNKERTQKLFVANSVSGTEKQVPFKSLEDFAVQLSQVVTRDNGESYSVPIVAVGTTNLTESVKELKDKYGCEAADVSTQLRIRINPETALVEVTGGSVSCEVLEEKKAAGVIDGVKNLFGFGGGKDEQVPLGEGEVDAEIAAAEKDKTSTSERPKPSDSKDAKSKTKDKDAKAAAESSKEPELKTRVVYVGIEADEIGLPRLRGTSLERIQERMKAFDQSDKTRKQRDAALNDLESYSYKIRDLVEDADFIAASTDALRAEISQKARDAGEWIYGDGADAALADFQLRLKELKGLVVPVMTRKNEASQRDVELKSYREILNSTKAIVESIAKTNAERKEQQASKEAVAASSSSAAAAASPSASSGDPADAEETPSAPLGDEPFTFELPTLSDESIAELEKAYNTAQAWLDEKVLAQSKLLATQDPAFTVAELKKKGAELQSAALELLTKQMDMGKLKNQKKSKSKKSSPKTKGKGKKTSSGSETATETETQATAETSASAESVAASKESPVIRDEL